MKGVKVNHKNNTGRKKVVVIVDSMVKYLKPNGLASRENFVKFSAQSRAATEDMLHYIKPVVRDKPDIVIINIGTEDLRNAVKIMSKVIKQCIRGNDKDKSIQIRFSSICYRIDRHLEKEINDANCN